MIVNYSLLSGFMAGVGITLISFSAYDALIDPDNIKAEPVFTPALIDAVTASKTNKAILKPASEEYQAFSNLSYCDQLDVIANLRGSVTQFIIDSGKVSDYVWAIKVDCIWHLDQLKNLSDVKTLDEYYRQARETATANNWNNCNGIKEEGEAYTNDCYSELGTGY